MENSRNDRLKFIIVLFGVFLVSFGVLAFEISSIRIFSVMFSYHYTFLAVSVSLLGLGLGGALTQAFSWKMPLHRIFAALTVISVILSFAAAFFILVMVPASGSNIVSDVVAMILPFFIAGVFLATIYQIFTNQSNMLYFADLLGAAIGALATVFLLDSFGAIKTIFVVSIFTSTSALLFALFSRRKAVVSIAVAGIVILLVLTQYAAPMKSLSIRLHEDQGKELADLMANPSLGARIIDSRWSTFGRTDLVELDAEPHFKIIYVDGGAGTRMFHFDGDVNSPGTAVSSLKNTTQYFPYYLARKGNALVIGPGGGIDVLTALIGGMYHTTAVEVNPDIVSIVQDYSEYNGGIYTKYNNIHVNVDEGRSFLRRSNEEFDIIMLDIPITKTPQGTIGYALAENYLFTTESFVDFLDHLSNNGMLTVVAHDAPEVYKLLSIAFKVLTNKGFDASEIMRRVAIVGGSSHHDFPVFILKKTPFTSGEAGFIYAKSLEIGLKPQFTPYVDAPFDPFLTALASGEVSMDAAMSMAPFDMTPPTDDNPFFYKFEKTIPDALWQLLTGAVVLSVGVSGLYIIVWIRRLSLAWKKELHSLVSKFSLFRPYYFASLGLGFMLIEVPLFQRFILFLGHPTLALAVLLFSLLLASGLGSFYSRRWHGHELFNAFKVSLAIAAMVVFYLIALPFVFNVFLTYDLTLRSLASFALIFPLGFLLGIPFPTGLRLTAEKAENDVAWMWCMNGVFSVLGSTLALIGAMTINFSAVLLTGGLVYLGIFLVGRTWSLKEKETEGIEEAQLNEEEEQRKLAKKQRRREWKERQWNKRTQTHH